MENFLSKKYEVKIMKEMNFEDECCRIAESMIDEIQAIKAQDIRLSTGPRSKVSLKRKLTSRIWFARRLVARGV